MARICLITPHHISLQPRALREADTLSAAGHKVRVVCRQTDSAVTENDRALMKSRSWQLQAVELSRNGKSRPQWLREAARAKLYEKVFNLGFRNEPVASRAYVRGLRAALSLASSEGADWVIAHTQAALPIAAVAARRLNARLGFDCEDLLSELGLDPPEIVRLIERRYLPTCDYISVPSASMAERLAAQHDIDLPIVLHNVFPLKLAEGLVAPKNRSYDGPLRLHWFGQTIGEGRGLEEAVTAINSLGTSVELHLRGRVTESERARLESIAGRHGANAKLIFHPLVNHDELIKTLDQFDVGLSLERPDNPNYSRALTNKLFSYLLAGLAIAATDTMGHREVFSDAPAAGFLYPAGAPQALAEKLRGWIDDRQSLRAAQQVAWDSARVRFCWDIEKEKFLSLVH